MSIVSYLVGARTRIHLDGRSLGGAISIVLRIDAASLATAEVTFYELGEDRKFVWDPETCAHRRHTITAAVKDIRKDGAGKMVFDLVTMAKGMTKNEQDDLIALIRRSSKPLMEEKTDVKISDPKNAAR